MAFDDSTHDEDAQTRVMRTDPITVPGQKYCLLSVIGPDCPQVGEQLAIKVRGSFATMDDAKAHAAQLILRDRFVNIFIATMYEWLPVPPRLDRIEDVQYQEEFLATMFKDFKQREADGRAAFEAHKRELMEGGGRSAQTDASDEDGYREVDLTAAPSSPPDADDSPFGGESDRAGSGSA